MSKRISLTDSDMNDYTNLFIGSLQDLCVTTAHHLTRPVRVVGEKTRYKPLLEFAFNVTEYLIKDFTKLLENRFSEYEHSQGSLEHMARTMNCGEGAEEQARKYQRKMRNSISNVFSDFNKNHIVHDSSGINWGTSTADVTSENYIEVENIIKKFNGNLDQLHTRVMNKINDKAVNNSLYESLIPVIEYIFSEFKDALSSMCSGIKKELSVYESRRAKIQKDASSASSDLKSKKKAGNLFENIKLSI